MCVFPGEGVAGVGLWGAASRKRLFTCIFADSNWPHWARAQKKLLGESDADRLIKAAIIHVIK